MKWKDRFNHACCAAAEYKDVSHTNILITSFCCCTVPDVKTNQIMSLISTDIHSQKAIIDIGPQCTQYTPIAEEMFDSVVGDLLESACPEAKRLKEICASLPKLVLPKGAWKPVSLTGAALDLIVVLSDTSTPDD